MKKNALIVLLISIIMLDAGCFTFLSTFKKRQTKNLSRALASISPSDKPVHGTALVLLPSDVEILKHYLDFTMFLQVSDVEIQKNCISYVPDPQLWEMSRGYKIGRNYDNFSIMIAKNNLQFAADAIRKIGIFDSVSVTYQNGNPALFPIGEYDYLVFVDVDGWFLKGRDNPRPVAISFGKNKLPLDLLQEQGKALRSK